MIQYLTSISHSIAFLLGISISGLVLGRSVFAVFLGLAIVLILIDKPFADIGRNFRQAYKSRLTMILLFVFLASLPSLIASDFPRRSAVTLFRTFIFFNLGILIWGYLKDNPSLRERWMKSLVISSAIAIGFALYSQYVSPELYWFLHLKGWKSDVLNHNLKGFSSVTLFIIPLLCLTCKHVNTLYRGIAILTGIGFCYLVWDISNRATIAGMLGIIVILAVALCLRFGNRLQILTTAAFAAICVGLAFLWLRITRARMIDAAPDGEYFLPVWLIDFERQTIWNYALEIGFRTPWFGRGPNTINFASGADQPLAGSGGLHVIPAHPHNWVVELFAEVGAISLTLLFVLLLVAGYNLLRRYRGNGDPAYLVTLAIFTGYWGSGLFNFSFWSSWWQLSFILSLALSLALRQDLIADDKSSGHRPKPSE